MADILEGLNEAQREAVTATEGYVRVIAGAGSGKTRALSHRFAWLVTEIGVMPSAILCVTFTNKSANEMRRRIRNLTGDSDTGHICTFHSFCATLLQEEAHAVGYPGSFIVLDNADINSMLQVIYEERGLTLRDMTFSDARDMIEMKKTKYVPDYYKDMLAMPLDILRQKYLSAVKTDEIIFYGYLYQEKKCFGLDYNDLIVFTLHIFDTRDDIRDKWQHQIEYVMIDEFQDIDEPQYELMEVLSGYHKNLFIVGDPDQTIYTWRGANVRYLLEFAQNHPGTRTIQMMENYRSTPQILAVANSLIAKNRNRIEKDLIPTHPDGEPVLCHHAKTAEDEARWIAERISLLQEQGIGLGDITLLYRAHYLTRSLEEALLDRRIPYTIYSGIQFFARREVKDALSYLRMVLIQDDLSFLRIANVPKRNLGKRRMAFLQETAEQEDCSLFDALRRHLDHEIFRGTKAAAFVSLIEDFSAAWEGRSVSELLSQLLHESGYEQMLRTEGSQERLDNLAELKQAIYDYENSCGEEATLPHYLSHVALMTNQDAGETPDRVKLMTVHAAKGLEFPVVFLCGMNEGIFPSRKIRTYPAMEEERRLAFVAITRAERALFLTEAEGRNLDGSPRYPSRFVLDVDPALIQYTVPPRQGLIEDARAYAAASEAALQAAPEDAILPEGTRVRHSVFGPGTVVGEDAEKQAHMIQFDSMPTPRSITWKAKLEIM